MPFTEDFSAFLSPAEFATSVSVAGVSLNAIFDNGYALGSVGPYGMASTQPALTLPTASIIADPVGLACVVLGKSYTVAAHEPDGTGISRLVLEAA